MIAPDILSEEKIHNCLPDASKDLPIFVFDSLDSTNTKAKTMISDEGIKRALIIADYQTAGRGRIGHTFFSPKGSGIYMSYVFTPKDLKDAHRLTTKAAVCVLESIKELYGIDVKVKWVNDIYLDDKKICGILTEAVTTGINVGSLVCGIGINFSSSFFPDEIKDIAASLPENKDVTRNLLISTIVGKLEREASDLSSTEYIKKYREASMLTGCEITFIENDIQYSAFVIDVDDDAGLVVEMKDKSTRTLRNGEVFTIRQK